MTLQELYIDLLDRIESEEITKEEAVDQLAKAGVNRIDAHETIFPKSDVIGDEE